MKETILHQRKFKRVTARGLETAVAQLTQLGNQQPYFSVTNDSGAAHEDIAKAFPELKPLIALHLCNEQGKPMHAVANGLYFLEQADFSAAARHFRIPGTEAEELWYQYVVVREKAQRSAQKASKEEWERFEAALREALEPLARELESLGNSHYVRYEKAFRKFNYKLLMKTAKEIKEGTPELKELAEILEETAQAVRKGVLNRVFGGVSLGEMITAKRAFLSSWREASRILSRKKGHVIEQKAEAKLRYHKKVWMEDIISACFASCWKRQAQAAIEFLKEPDLIDVPESYEDEEDLLMKVGSDTLPIIDVNHYDPSSVVSGGYEYVVFRTREEAGEAAEEYWRNMAKNDKGEFKCLVGEENLLAWALGESAGPGSKKVNSLEEWFNLWENHPEEQWASYDWEEVSGYVNEPLAEELGWSFEPDETGWMPVVAYRRN
ncbi:MAG TPA: hypothetical protein ENJ30_12615 [Desulfobulbaceae bacterium]|nr:hypothetical protein [Desulfobulbaceae bacterium]